MESTPLSTASTPIAAAIARRVSADFSATSPNDVIPAAVASPDLFAVFAKVLATRIIMEANGTLVNIGQIRAECEAELAAETGTSLPPNLLTTLKKIRQKEAELNRTELLEYNTGSKQTLVSPHKGVPLLKYDIPYGQVLKGWLMYAETFYSSNPKAGLKYFDEYSIYAASPGSTLQGQKKIEEEIGGQLDQVKKMTYECLGADIYANRITTLWVNRVKTASGKKYEFINGTIMYFQGFDKKDKPVFAFNLDLMDRAHAYYQVVKYKLASATEGCC